MGAGHEISGSEISVFPTGSHCKYIVCLLSGGAVQPGLAVACLRLGLSSLSAVLKLCLLKLCSVPIIYPTWSKITRGYDICADSLDLKCFFLTLCRRL